MNFEDYLVKVAKATNLTELSLIEDDYVIDYAPNATEAENKRFTETVDNMRQKLLPKIKGEFDVSLISAPSQPKMAKVRNIRTGSSDLIGENYVITIGRESQPYALPAIDFPNLKGLSLVPKGNIEPLTIFMSNVPPKNITYYIPHIEGDKLVKVDIKRNSELGHLHTLMRNYVDQGGSVAFNNVWKTTNEFYAISVGNTEITKVKTILYYPDEPIIWRVIYSFWASKNGRIVPVPIEVME